MKFIIGIDIGTTATKGVLYDLNGQEHMTASQSYPLIQKEALQAEEDPEVIFAAVEKIIFTLANKAKGKIIAISWSSQMHSLLGLGKSGQLLTNSITWADNRCFKIVEKAKIDGLAQRIYQKMGVPMHPMAPIYKLMWLKQKEPQLFEKVEKWIGIKEYIIFRLSGKIMTDISMAAGTGMLNLKTLDWDSELLQLLKIKHLNLPNIVNSTKAIPLKLKYLQKLGLKEDTKLVIGASDGYLSTIGAGSIDGSHFALNVGTSGAIRTISSQIKLNKQAQYFCYPASSNQFLLGEPVNNGGIVLEWAKKTLLNDNSSVQDLLDLAQTAPAAARNLIFLPYLGGERAPIWDANARGCFVGLTRQHTKADLARAVVEGIIFNLFDAALELIRNTQKPVAINATGGFFQSDFIKQLCANIFDIPVALMKQQQSGTLAAMFLARQALGLNTNLIEIKHFVQEDRIYHPNKKEAAIYQDLFPLYREIRNDLATSYRKFSAKK